MQGAAPAYAAARDAVWEALGPAAPPPIADLDLDAWLQAEVGRSLDGVKHVRLLSSTWRSCSGHTAVGNLIASVSDTTDFVTPTLSGQC